MWLRRFLPLVVLTISAQADATADRRAIANAITVLNQPQHLTGVIFPLIDRLLKGRKTILGTTAGTPTVTISHEPWGEAELNFPQVPEIINPRIVGGEARFITPFLAHVYGTFTYLEAGKPTEVIPLLFVLRRESETWRIVAASAVTSQ